MVVLRGSHVFSLNIFSTNQLYKKLTNQISNILISPFLLSSECRFVNKLPSGKKEVTEKSSQSEDRAMEVHVNKPMTLRSKRKNATTNKKDTDRATVRKRYKLRSRRGQERRMNSLKSDVYH